MAVTTGAVAPRFLAGDWSPESLGVAVTLCFVPVLGAALA